VLGISQNQRFSSLLFLQTIAYSGEGTGEWDSLHSGQGIAMNYGDRQVASGSRGGALAAFPPPLYVKTALIA